ncbi:ATP-binding protein [Streptomyces alanosinicus]|nr:ATP-binding protein [Streptomyces alanosinicus]
MPCEPESVRRARLLTITVLSSWGIDELVDAATLVVDELLTNVIDHTDCHNARVILRRIADDRVRIGVADRFRGVPNRSSPSEDSEGGRGLILVEALADRWGYDRHPAWKVVWAELHVKASQ